MTNISTTTKCQISGTLEKIIYKNEENGFIVFSLQVNSQKTITVSGKQVFLNEGELLEIEGEWVNHTKFGRQFKAQKIRISLPSSTEGIKKYLGSSLIKGIGPQSIDLLQAIGGSNRAVYLKTGIYCPETKSVQLQMGSDDGIKVWINGKPVHANNVVRGMSIGEDKAGAKLEKGWNTFLVKICQGSGDWALSLRVCEPEGSPLEGMRVDINKPQ